MVCFHPNNRFEASTQLARGLGERLQAMAQAEEAGSTTYIWGLIAIVSSQGTDVLKEVE